MRPMYFGEYRLDVGKCFFKGINELIIEILNKSAIIESENLGKFKKNKRDTNVNMEDSINIEQLCKLIFYLKKNFSYKELLEYGELIQNVYNLTIHLIVNLSDNLVSLIYLMLFFGYFSKLLISNRFIEKETIINLIFDISKKIIDRIFYEKISSISAYNNLSVNRSFANSNFNNSIIEYNEELGEEFFEGDEENINDFYYAFGDLTSGM